MTPNEANSSAKTSAQTPRRGVLKSSNEHPLAWTERVARSRPRAPVRRLSASEEAGSRQNHAPSPLAVTDRALDADNQGRDIKEVGSFGFPIPIIPYPRASNSIDLSNELANYAFRQNMPDYCNGEVRENHHDNGISPSRYQRSPRLERHQRTVSFADEQDEVNASDTEQSDIPLGEQLEQAFTLHALYQGEGGVLPNRFATTTAAQDNPTPQAKTKFKLFQRPRTLILGHKAGLWLTNYAFDSFCQVANTLILHQWDDMGGYPKDYSKVKDRGKLDITVEIKDGNKRIKRVVIKLHTEAGRKQYEKLILPVLQKQEPKPRIRVHDGKLKCDFDCKREPKDKEPSCDNSRDLEVEVPDVGFLRVLADWHRWRKQPKLIENSKVFENAVFRLLFPTTTDKHEFAIELPDGTTFHVSRKAQPALPADVQEALSHMTTAESQQGVTPQKIKLLPYTTSQKHILERPPESPGQKSPGLARAEGTIFVHRPANFTHFRYDFPQTMERFFKLARRELYPDTQGRLRLRISPSNAFRQEGKLLLPIVERKGSYGDRDDEGETPEDVWKDSIVDKWLTPLEDVWIVKVFDAIRVFDGLWDENVQYEPECWDVSALQNRASHDSEDTGWNIPPESLMDDLAKISIKFLDVDPRNSSRGIVLHVKRETPGEWLRWKAPMTFLEFMLEILYKIDGEAIAIYPGDYEEPEERIDVELEQNRAAEAMAQMKRKKTIVAKDAVEAFGRPVLLRNPAQADGRFNNLGHLAIQLPQTTWDPEGTHLEPAPSYASNALIYSVTDMGLLQQRLFRAENEILMREEACRLNLNQDVVKHISDHGQRICPATNCHCPLWVLTHKQLIDHLKLHPETSNVRNEIQKVPPKLRRESATQTNADDLDPRYRYRLDSKDSLTELPTGEAKLWCSKCYQYIHELNEKELEDHAKQCRTTIRDFTPLEVRKTNPITTLKSRHKPTTSRARPYGRSTAVDATFPGTEAVDNPVSTVDGKGKRKAAASKPPPEILIVAPSKGTAADSKALNHGEAAREAKFTAMVQKARSAKASTTSQNRPTRSKSVPLASDKASEAPTPAQLRVGERGNIPVQGQQHQGALNNLQSKQKSVLGSSRTTRANTDAVGATEQVVIAPSSKRVSGVLVRKNEAAPKEATKKLPLARSKRKTRETEADPKFVDPLPPSKRRRTKLTQGGEKATEPAAEESTAQKPATAVSQAPGPPPGKLSRKRALMAKAEDVKDSDTPERPTRPIRKPRTRKAKVGDAPTPQDLTTAVPEGQPPEPPKRTRASRAKKTDTQTERTDPAQIPADAGKEGTPATTSPRKRKAPVSKTITETKSAKKRKLDQPGDKTNMAVETASAVPDAAGADNHNPAESFGKGKCKGKVEELSAEPTTTSPKKRRILTPKTKTKAPTGKKRKTAANEDETETQSAVPAKNKVTGPSLPTSQQEEPQIGPDEVVPEDSPKKGKGKAKAQTQAPKSTIATPRKRKAPATKITTSTTSPAKKRKAAPDNETPAESSTAEGVVPSVEPAASASRIEGVVADMGVGQGVLVAGEEQATLPGRGKRKRLPTPKVAAADEEKRTKRGDE
ncbi:MAG: hypothetical protein Q9209_001408 [Squamulea sp. 1 TL-2023]